MHGGFWWQNPKERHNLDELGVDGRIKLKWIFKKQDGKVWTGLIWLRTGTSGELLSVRYWTSGFHTMWRMSQLAEEISALQKQMLHGVSGSVSTWTLFPHVSCELKKLLPSQALRMLFPLCAARCLPHVPPIWITSTCTCNGNAAQFQGWLYCSMDQGSLLQFANGTHRSLQWSGHCGWWTWISACRVDTLPLPARPIHKMSRHFSQ